MMIQLFLQITPILFPELQTAFARSIDQPLFSGLKLLGIRDTGNLPAKSIEEAYINPLGQPDTFTYDG